MQLENLTRIHARKLAAAGAVLLGLSATLVAPAATARAATVSGRTGSVVNTSLSAVSCTSATNCMAVGGYDASGRRSFEFTLTEAWNGTTWRVIPSPTPSDPGGGAMLNSVSCPSGTRCMAVGFSIRFHATGGFDSYLPFVIAWDGTAWTRVPTPTLRDSSAFLNAVSCDSSSDCMAVGSIGTPKAPTDFTLAEHWNGEEWTVLSTPAPLTPGGTALSGISCTSSSACTAVGYYGYNDGTGTSIDLTEVWNGSRWYRVGAPTPGNSGSFGGVSCPSSLDCVAVGEHARPTGNLIRATLAEQLQGGHWNVLTSPNPRGAGAAGLDSVSCTSSTTCMATGGWVDQTGESASTLAESWNGSNWDILPTPGPGSFGNELRGVSCTAASACTAVGDYTGIGNQLPLAESWNGTRWTNTRAVRP